MQVEIVDPGERRDEWLDYVAKSGAASLYHRGEWQDILLRTFKHRAYVVFVRDAGAVRGVLPLVEMRHLLFGHFLVSLPFVNYGGIIADAPVYEAALAKAAAGLALRCGAGHIELRHRGALPALSEEGWRLRTHKSALVIPLAEGAQQRWDLLSSRLRGKVRKAEKSESVFSSGGSEAIDEFYRVYSLNMRNLGTPVYAAAFFRNIVDLQPASAVLVVRRRGAPVAAALALLHEDRVELPWICSDYAHSNWYVNEFLYWKSIEWACERGARELDLGRSTTDSGPYRFKLQWNPDVAPLHWYYWTAPGATLPELHPSNPKYALAVRCWKKLPLPVANRLGPSIVRNIP